ncbi:hypothetical protein N0V82_008144 [Gnomoniopsis sp. IMI 355080]|nr:hypothetical protein N0V82_008144 [Gnomoniopsis sp. IMI 355080]
MTASTAKMGLAVLPLLASIATAYVVPEYSPSGFSLIRDDASTSRTTAPTGCISVKSDASGTDEYSSLTSALASLSGSDSACIFMYGGTYSEQVAIDYEGPLTIYGYTTDTSSYADNAVTITHTISSSDAGSLDASSTLDITSSNFSMYNINVENGYGSGAQAVAVTANGDNQGYYGCAFSSYQDTLYAKSGTQYYSQCLITGAVDYIFGDAAAWFEASTIASNGGGSITANSRETTDDTTWYVFNKCTIQQSEDATEDLSGEVYLGRPWRVLARVMFQRSTLSDIINADGWTTMADDATPIYMEYENTGAGSNTSARLYETAASGPAEITWLYETSWIDSSYPSTSTASSSGSSASASASAVAPSGASSSATATQASGSSASVGDTSTGATCTPTAGGSSSTDDTPAIASAIAECSDGTIVIPAGTTYYLNTALSFEDCTGCTMELEGTLMTSDDLDYWATQGAIITIESVTGASIISTTGQGVFDGNGQAAWDAFAADNSLARATMLLVAKSSNVVISSVYFKDAPNVFHSCNDDSTNVEYNDITLYAVSSSDNVAQNTDGWDIGPATYVTINGANVTNDDDCVAFKPGASYVTVLDITCTGSHGLSVGSLGESGTNTVENVYVNGATMVSSAKAMGIKLYPGGDEYGTAVVSNVTWENIVVTDCDYAFQVQSCYNADTDYCTEYPSNATLTDIVVKNVSGSTSGTDAMNIDCPADGTCGITMSDITVTGSDGSSTYLCANTDADIGITCTDGASG